jgi:hypothetical protein
MNPEEIREFECEGVRWTVRRDTGVRTSTSSKGSIRRTVNAAFCSPLLAVNGAFDRWD